MTNQIIYDLWQLFKTDPNRAILQAKFKRLKKVVQKMQQKHDEQIKPINNNNTSIHKACETC